MQWIKYDIPLIIKHLADKFENSDFNCLGEDTEKYISISALMDKIVTKINE